MARTFESDSAYRNWLEQNLNGYVLNVRANKAPGYAILHVASCLSINNDRYASGAFTERSYRKVCANTSVDLVQWLERHMPKQRGFSAEFGCTSRARPGSK